MLRRLFKSLFILLLIVSCVDDEKDFHTWRDETYDHHDSSCGNTSLPSNICVLKNIYGDIQCWDRMPEYECGTISWILSNSDDSTSFLSDNDFIKYKRYYPDSTCVELCLDQGDPCDGVDDRMCVKLTGWCNEEINYFNCDSL